MKTVLTEESQTHVLMEVDSTSENVQNNADLKDVHDDLNFIRKGPPADSESINQ